MNCEPLKVVSGAAAGASVTASKRTYVTGRVADRLGQAARAARTGCWCDRELICRPAGGVLRPAGASLISIWRGEFAHALAEGQEQAQLGRDAAETQTLASGLWVQGFAERCLGRLEAAITHLQQALEIAESSGNIFLRIMAANELGQCYLRHARWQAALDTVEASDSFIVEHNFRRAPFPNALLRNALAATYLMAAEQSDPREKNAWLKKVGRACRAALRWGKSLCPGKPEALRLQGRYEWLKGNTAQAQRWWQKSLAEATTLGMPYELGLTHEVFTADPDDRRELMVQIWYPAEGNRSAPRAPWVQDTDALAPALARLFRLPDFTFGYLKYITTFVRVPGIFHVNQTDIPLLSPLMSLVGLAGPIDAQPAHSIVNAYSLAFFDRHLKGRPATLLGGPAKQYPEVLFETRRP